MLLMPIAFPVVCRRHVQSEVTIQQKTFKSLQREGDGNREVGNEEGKQERGGVSQGTVNGSRFISTGDGGEPKVGPTQLTP